jgi:hypothetical protein
MFVSLHYDQHSGKTLASVVAAWLLRIAIDARIDSLTSLSSSPRPDDGRLRLLLIPRRMRGA